MKLFQNGAEVKKYTGARTTEALIKFMEDAVGVKEVGGVQYTMHMWCASQLAFQLKAHSRG